MDPFEELERMALNAEADDNTISNDERSSEQIARWQRIFKYSHEQAVQQIRSHREDVTRMRISDSHWESLQTRLDGYDLEAYEHELMLNKQKRPASASRPKVGSTPASTAMFLFRLSNTERGEPLTAPCEVQAAAKMTRLPDTYAGAGEDQAVFCLVSASARQCIEQYLTTRFPGFRPVFIQHSIARKELDDSSAYPTLGLDTTLPQHRARKLHQPPDMDPNLPQNRANKIVERFSPHQRQFPVWYFFYGTLAVPENLVRILNLDHSPTLEVATVKGGVIKTWSGKYKALTNGPSEAEVDGWAYWVETEEHEAALRAYETGEYEVVRCNIHFRSGTTQAGCTFRFINTGLLNEP